MRIIGKECGKILNLRVLAVIAAFTFLYYQVFMEDAYAVNNRWMKHIYSMAEELVEEVGTTLSREELPLLYRKREELAAKVDMRIAGNPVLAEAGVVSYDEIYETLDEIREIREEKLARGEELTEQEQRLDLEIQGLWFGGTWNGGVWEEGSDGEVTKYLKQIGYLDDMIETCLYEECFGVPGEDAERIVKKYYGDWASPLYLKAETFFCQREMSLLPHELYLDILWPDMRSMVRLLVICCFLLIVPYQVHERLRGVAPLYASTYTGRRIFGKQFYASIFSCGLLCVVQLLVYLGVFVSKRLWVFWRCPAWSDSVNEFWFPYSFGLYIVVYMLMVWLFAMGSAVLAYCIGRWASNYVTGIALSIPVGVIVCMLGMRMLYSLFCFYFYVQVPLWEVPALAAWLAAAAALVGLVFRKDRRRGL